MDIGSEPTRIRERLEAVEVDVNRELESHWGTIHEYLTRFMTFRGVDETVAEELAILPGMEELFSLVRVAAWADSGRWDTIVIDCAPTGDTVRMLAVPEVLRFYFSRIFPIQRTVVRTVRPVAQRMTDMPIPTDDVFAAVQRVHEQMETIGPMLQDPSRSSIRIVLNPERMVINESQRLYTYLCLFGFAWGLCNWGFITWLPDMLRTAGFEAGLSSELLSRSAVYALPGTILAALSYGFWSSRWTAVLAAGAPALSATR